MARLVKLTNKPSDNFFAEMLVKDLALQARGRGTTAGGARLAAAFARRLGAGRQPGGRLGALARRPRLAATRWSGCSGALVRNEDGYDDFVASLPIAGRDGTLVDRMRSGPGAQPLPRQDRHALRRERAVRLLRGPLGRHSTRSRS